MDQISVIISNKSSNEDEAWSATINSINLESPLPLDGGEGGLFSGLFVPPPPRPIFLEDTISTDGLTTCDLCTWAWKTASSSIQETSLEATGELSWMFTLVIVSFVSALLGAIIMIIVLHCKRIKENSTSDETNPPSQQRRPPGLRLPMTPPKDKPISTITPANFPSPLPLTGGGGPGAHSGVWSWLSRRPPLPSPLDHPPCGHAHENHYTHLEDSYNHSGVGEALYAELDRDDVREGNGSPAYQNSAYTDPDVQISSAPSSAYYSDLSVHTPSNQERAYEIVGLATLSSNTSTPSCPPSERGGSCSKLEAIKEHSNFQPSDYV